MASWRLVVQHFLEVRDEPAVVHGIAMEAAAELIVHAARGHLAQSEQHHVERFLVLRARVVAQQKVVDRGTRELGRAAEAAEARIEGAAEDREAALQRVRVEAAPPAWSAPRPLLPQAAPPRRAPIRRSCSRSLCHASAICVENGAESRMAPAILRRKIRAAEKRLRVPA